MDFYNSTIFGLKIKYIFLLPEVRSNFIPTQYEVKKTFITAPFLGENNYISFSFQKSEVILDPKYTVYIQNITTFSVDWKNNNSHKVIMTPFLI